MSLKNKVALITGAASGIGQATAIHFASLGAKLSLVDVNPNFEETVKQCYETGITVKDHVLIQAMDVTDPVAVAPPEVIARRHCPVGQEELVRKTVEHFGQADVLINCAGVVGVEQNLDNITMECFDAVMNINFKSGLRLIQICVPYLKKTKGSVVNVSSMASMYKYPYSLTYKVSKSAVDQLTRYAAQQLAPFGIRVNSVNPGPVRTNVTKTMSISKEEWMSLVAPWLADPVQIAKPIAFLASGNASFINGIHLPVDGGRCLDF